MKRNAHSCSDNSAKATSSFDLFRLSKSKEVVDLSSNTLRAYNKSGLPFYRNGKVVFISKAELESYIRATSAICAGKVIA